MFKTFFSSATMYFYLAITLVVGTAWTVDHHYQYHLGAKSCQVQVEKDNNSILLYLQKEQASYEAGAAAQAAKDKEKIEAALNSKTTIVRTVYEKANTSTAAAPDSVVLDADELRYFNSIIEGDQGR